MALVSKQPIGYGNTRLAALGMACTGLAAEDDVERFVDDVLESGEEISDRRLAEVVAREAPSAVAALESRGFLFRRDPHGRWTFGKGSGHSVARTLSRFKGGVSLGQVLRAASARGEVDVYEEVMATRLLTRDGSVGGVVGLHLPGGQVLAFGCKSLVLATGGAGWLYYPHTDCDRSATGDGYALALQAGAELIDMEQVQFLPFALSHPTSMVGVNVGEPFTAGEHGRLLNARGDPVLTGINGMTRARVARAIALEIKRSNGTEHGGLLLDLAGNLAAGGQALWDVVYQRIPFDAVRVAYGERAFRWEEPWDVLPTAHFTMGGIRTDEWGRSTIEGLYAAGEASGGLHGGNRLSGVALTEAFVFGGRAGERAALEAARRKRPEVDAAEAAEEEKRLLALYGAGGQHPPARLVRRLQTTMWEKVGPAREERDLAAALEEIEEIARAARDVTTPRTRRYNPAVAGALELQEMLDVARATVLSALERRESRGAHVRTDFPGRDEGLRLKKIVALRREGRVQCRPVPVGVG